MEIFTKKILVTNDDGLNSLGLIELAKALKGLGEIWIVVPDRDRSNASHGLTLNTPLRLDRLELDGEDRVYSTDGTPSDCVYLLLSHLLGNTKVDLVVSGINLGLNLADDISYSGTVGAALEAVLLDVPAIAVSVQTFNKGALTNSAAITRELAAKILSEPDLLPPGVFLNVNVPECAKDRKFKMTTVGRRRYTKNVKPIIDPKGSTYYWIGGEPLQHDNIPGSDCNAVFDEQLISITLIDASMTYNNALTRWNSVKLQEFQQII
jgi:5'-nucleotidase